MVQVRRNGTTIEAEATLVEAGNGTTVSFSTLVGLSAGDYLEVIVTSGAALSICGGGARYTTFSLVRLGA